MLVPAPDPSTVAPPIEGLDDQAVPSYPTVVATTVGYDGTAWSSRPSMGGATVEGSGAGTSIAALSIGGSPAETGVEEFTGVTETATASTLTTS